MSSADKHTPGPWTVGHHHPDCEITATIHGADGEYVAHTSDEDASLIAAAPDMLEALRVLLVQSKPYEDGDGAAMFHAQNIARDAIAKATGGVQ